jgi:hypothetical protein
VVVGQVAGIRMFPVLLLGKTRMVEIVRGVVSLVMLCVRRIPRHRHHITLPQSRRASFALYLAITVGVKRMKLSP